MVVWVASKNCVIPLTRATRLHFGYQNEVDEEIKGVEQTVCDAWSALIGICSVS